MCCVLLGKKRVWSQVHVIRYLDNPRSLCAYASGRLDSTLFKGCHRSGGGLLHLYRSGSVPSALGSEHHPMFFGWWVGRHASVPDKEPSQRFPMMMDALSDGLQQARGGAEPRKQKQKTALNTAPKSWNGLFVGGVVTFFFSILSQDSSGTDLGSDSTLGWSAFCLSL